MTANEILDALKAASPGIDAHVGTAMDMPTLVVPGGQIVAACSALRETRGLAFEALTDITAVDYWPAEPRFAVVYHLVSFEARQRLRLKVLLGGADPCVPTLSQMWPGANWLEREVWDLFGVVFSGHENLTRLLTPEDWEGHPLRKDYPVQVRMAPKVYEPLQITEDEFRRHVEADRRVREHRGRTR